MTKVDGSLISLIQGVSQQAPVKRLPGQCEEQVNFSSDPVNNLTRRGGTRRVGNLFSSASKYYFDSYDGGSQGTFEIAYRKGDIKVFDKDGTELTVTASSTSYIPDGGAEFAGIDDKIYMVNPNVTTAMQTDVRSYVDEGILVFFLGGQYGRAYTIRVRWISSGVSKTDFVSFNTPTGANSSDIQDVSTNNIASELKTLLEANSLISTDFDVSITKDVLFISPKAGQSVTTHFAEISDGDGGSNMFVVNRTVRDSGELPRFAPNGYLVKVLENSASDLDDWYLEFVTSAANTAGAGFGEEGFWVETVAPDVPYIIDPSTMPHVLTKTGATTFTFGPAEWSDRAVGDLETNPDPSFIGSNITDIGAFQGRLTFTAGTAVILSRTNELTNFFRESATALIDSDPIDVESALGTYELKRIVPHNRDLILFGERVQFIIFGRNNITPKNTSLVLTSEFDADLTAKPVAAGVNVFFAFNRGEYSGIQEFFTDASKDLNDAREITQHVLQYIESQVVQLVSSSNFNTLVVRSDSDLSNVKVYEYVRRNGVLEQSAWSTWEFHKDVLHMFFRGNLLYCVLEDGDDYELCTINLDDSLDPGAGYRVALDDKETFVGVNSTFTPDQSVEDIDKFTVVQGTGCPHPGLSVNVASFVSGVVTLDDDMQGGSVIFGRKFSSLYQPTRPYVKNRKGFNISTGTLRIKSYNVHYKDTGYFKQVTLNDNGLSNTQTFSGVVLSDTDAILGDPVVVTGNHTFSYQQRADNSAMQIVSDTHLPCTITEIDWYGSWRKRGRRV